LVSIFKYINIINNNIFRINSYNNMIHDNIFIQLLVAILYYTGYCYGTDNCDIGRCKYVSIVCIGFSVSAVYCYLYADMSKEKEALVSHDQVQLVGVFIYCVLVEIYKGIGNMILSWKNS
jgi:hypothetical protein